MSRNVSGPYLKMLRLIHTALLAGQVIFLIVMLLLVMQHINPPVTDNYDKNLQVVAVLVSFGTVFMAGNFFKNRLLRINEAALDLETKKQLYRSANLVRWVMLEFAALFTSVCFFLTGNYSFAALALALIAFFGVSGPSKIKTMLQLKLTAQEAETLALK